MRIQIVEDDRALSEGIAMALKEPGTEFVQSVSVRAAREVFEEQKPGLIILDINLPDGSGYDYLRWVRERSQVPVLILTANDMEMDEVMGLTLGADDYMAKPFSLAVLRARIKVLLRRGQAQKEDVYEKDPFYSREQRAKRACLHAHLATAARVKYPAALQRYKFDAPLLAAGYLTLISGDLYLPGMAVRLHWG